MISKNDFLRFLDFPDEWIELNLYDERLFDIQLKFLIEDLGEDKFNKRIVKGKYGAGSEHWRFGAFIWIINNGDSKLFDKLKIVIQRERDEYLMKHMQSILNKTKIG